MEVKNITKAATLKICPQLSYKNTQLLFFVTMLFNIFMRQILTNDFGGLHKNMNCAFPPMFANHTCFRTRFYRRSYLHVLYVIGF